MNYERPYFEDINYHPLIFYVAFGVSDEQLNVSRERHHVDEFPEGLDISILKKPENIEYMQEMLGGTLGGMLYEQNPDLYKAIQSTDKWAVIRGEVQKDGNLHYMRNVIGFLQAFMETGAIGVLDLQTFGLYTAEEWTSNIFEPEFDPYSHVVILASEMEDGSVWLHTRGMRKFGRPDISMKGVPAQEVENAAQIINQMIFYGALGAFFVRPVKLHTHNGLTVIVSPQFVDDMDNPDFNNSYYRVRWEECEITTENDC